MFAFGMPMGAEWLCLFVFVCILGGAIVAVAIILSRKDSRAGFPVTPQPPTLPGRFRVSGIDRATKKDIVWQCEADSPENAKVKAELEGIIVTRVDRT